MQLTANFWLWEFEHSDRATRYGLDNRVPADLLDNIRRTALMLQGIRDFLCDVAGKDIAIRITSGYRTMQLNEIVGGSLSSDHMKGLAADWKAPAFGPPTMIVRQLMPHVDRLGIGQLIDEYPPHGWVHTGVPVPRLAHNRILRKTVGGLESLVSRTEVA